MGTGKASKGSKLRRARGLRQSRRVHEAGEPESCEGSSPGRGRSALPAPLQFAAGHDNESH